MKSSAVTNKNLREKRIRGNFLQRPLTRALFFIYLPSHLQYIYRPTADTGISEGHPTVKNTQKYREIELQAQSVRFNKSHLNSVQKIIAQWSITDPLCKQRDCIVWSDSLQARDASLLFVNLNTELFPADTRFQTIYRSFYSPLLVFTRLNQKKM